MSNYSERIDKISPTSLYQHRTLRTLFDPFSSELGHASIEKKLNFKEDSF